MRAKLDFIVNKEKRTVTCIASDCKFDIVNDLTKKLSSEKIDTQMILISDILSTNLLLLPDTFVGIAKCSPFDTFDEEYGKRLAIRKMRVKYNTAKDKIMDKFWHRYHNVLDILFELSSQYCDTVEKSEKYLQNCLEEKD